MKWNLKRTKPYELNIIVDLDTKDLEYYLNEARKHLANDLKIEGFRKGKVPFEIAKDKLDKKQVLNTAFDLAFRQSFSDVLAKEKIEVIEAGKFEVKENSSDQLIYSVLFTVFPNFEMADYKKIKAKKNNISVSEEEIDKTIESLRDSRKRNGIAPELNDEFAQSLGRFRNLNELRNNVRDGLKQEKEIKESQRIQSFILDKIAEETTIEAPPVLVDRQTDQMMLDLDADLRREGMEFGLFLAKIKKTKDELIAEWRPKAEALVKKALIMKEIAKKENISVDPGEVQEKLDQFTQSLGGVEEIQKNIDLQKLADQLRQIILNQKVLAFLEKESIS